MSDPPLGPEASGPPIIRVGLDASPLRIGWAISVSRTVVDAGTFHTPPGGWLRDRRAFFLELRDMIRRHEERHRIDLRTIGIEAPYVGPNRQGSLRHARNIGQAEAWMFSSFPYAEQLIVQPAAWRRAIGIAPKGKVAPRLYAETRWDEDVWEQDTADAICIVDALPMLEEER
jgi:hypothetical protein